MPPILIEIFSDASFDPKSKKGIGAYSKVIHNCHFIDSYVSPEIHSTKFIAKSCASLEIKAAIWALEECIGKIENAPTIKLYVDSMTIANLPQRRCKLEQNQFQSLKTKKPLSNKEDYQSFYQIYDKLSLIAPVEIIWIKGHTRSANRTREEALFSAVDLEARAQLRKVRD